VSALEDIAGIDLDDPAEEGAEQPCSGSLDSGDSFDYGTPRRWAGVDDCCSEVTDSVDDYVTCETDPLAAGYTDYSDCCLGYVVAAPDPEKPIAWCAPLPEDDSIEEVPEE